MDRVRSLERRLGAHCRAGAEMLSIGGFLDKVDENLRRAMAG
jgi:hypothetical protein